MPVPLVSRVTVIVLDSAGVGEMPDAASFGDFDVNTIGHVAKHAGGLDLPNMQSMGLGNLTHVEGVPPVTQDTAKGSWGKAAEESMGKDTLTGHWEMMGAVVEKPFPSYPNGFPAEAIAEFEKRTGRKVQCNKPASGTVIIDEFGEHHMKTGDWIVYTSNDPVFQIAAHEDVVSIDELYAACETAMEICKEICPVGRVIARPFIGTGKGKFTRTSRRHDYAVKPHKPTLLNKLKDHGKDVVAVGKINDIFSGEGVTSTRGTNEHNLDGMEKTEVALKEDTNGLIFVNLVDFDSAFGHRRDPEGYAKALKEFDDFLPRIFAAMKDDEVLLLTADHGCDPTYKGTDHTREYIPLLMYGKQIKTGQDVGIRASFTHIAATIDHLLLGNASEDSFAPALFD